jgi:small conductance mechanosensitive channel
VIPNRKIAGEILHNYGRIRQVGVTVGVAYDTDLNAAIAAIHDILQGNPKVLKDPKPIVQVAVLADSSIDIAVKPWASVADSVSVGGEIYKAVVESFRARGIVIPFPQREVRMLSKAA